MPGKKRRSARLRKKLHIGEFQEFGFAFEADIHESFTEQQVEDATFSLLEEVIEPRGLGMGGWLSGAYIQSMDQPSTTDEDRDAVRIWLEARPEVKAVRVGPLTDAWYPPEE